MHCSGCDKAAGLPIWQNFHFVTDHKALDSMFQPQENMGKLARNVDLYPYTFVVHHRLGKERANADSLSRTEQPSEQAEPEETSAAVISERLVAFARIFRSVQDRTSALSSSFAGLWCTTKAAWLKISIPTSQLSRCLQTLVHGDEGLTICQKVKPCSKKVAMQLSHSPSHACLLSSSCWPAAEERATAKPLETGKQI